MFPVLDFALVEFANGISGIRSERIIETGLPEDPSLHEPAAMLV